MDYDRENYQAKYAPQPQNNQRLEVGVGIEIFDMDNIDLQQLSFELNFDLVLLWNEGRFDRLKNLRRGMYSNKISTEGAEKLWIPNVEFKNSRQRMFVTFDEQTSLWVSSADNSTPAGIDEFNEARIYAIDSSKIAFLKSYKMAFKCKFDLTYYPFDMQHCGVQVRPTWLNLILKSVFRAKAILKLYHLLAEITKKLGRKTGISPKI